MSGLIDKNQLKLEDEATLNLLLRLLLYHFNLKRDALRLVRIMFFINISSDEICCILFTVDPLQDLSWHSSYMIYIYSRYGCVNS